MSIQDKLRERARALLESGEVGYIIGWGKGRFENQTTPLFISDPARADELVFNEYCINNTAKYVLDDMYPDKKIGICVRGCDARAVNRMIKDQQLKRENVYLLGIPCTGMKDFKTGELADKCTKCMHRNPVVFDEMLGEEVAEQTVADRFADVEKIEALNPDEKYDYWAKIFTKCIRCYACRNVCPACSCRECFADQYRVGWLGKQNNCAENQVYGLTRAFHVGDRCIECGECERVCPMDLPLMELNRKIIKDINTLFGPHEAGLDDTSDAPLGTYRTDDHEEFM